MSRRDQFGLQQATADAQAMRHLDLALSKLLTLNNDPVAEADRALACDPDFAMPHVIKGLANVLGTDPSLHAAARQALAAAEFLSAGRAATREGRHVAALRGWLDGRFSDAVTLWEEILLEWPHDALAMFAAHQTDFLPNLDAGSPLRGYYDGMHAFGLEEMGDYPNAISAGLRAVESDRRNAWAIHEIAAA